MALAYISEALPDPTINDVVTWLITDCTQDVAYNLALAHTLFDPVGMMEDDFRDDESEYQMAMVMGRETYPEVYPLLVEHYWASPTIADLEDAVSNEMAIYINSMELHDYEPGGHIYQFIPLPVMGANINMEEGVSREDVALLAPILDVLDYDLEEHEEESGFDLGRNESKLLSEVANSLAEHAKATGDIISLNVWAAIQWVLIKNTGNTLFDMSYYDAIEWDMPSPGWNEENLVGQGVCEALQLLDLAQAGLRAMHENPQIITDIVSNIHTLKGKDDAKWDNYRYLASNKSYSQSQTNGADLRFWRDCKHPDLDLLG